MNNTTFVSSLTGRSSPSKPSVFAAELTDKTSVSVPFAKALRGERLDRLEALTLRLDGIGSRLDALPMRSDFAPLSEGTKRPRRAREAEPEIRRGKNGKPIGEPSIYDNLAKLVEKLRIAREKELGMYPKKTPESVASRSTGSRTVGLREVCLIGVTGMCDCKRCVPSNS